MVGGRREIADRRRSRLMRRRLGGLEGGGRRMVFELETRKWWSIPRA